MWGECAECWSSSSWECSWYVRSSCIVFFFFQAEDGIRDVAVTGVQTCALPIPRQVTECFGFQADGSYSMRHLSPGHAEPLRSELFAFVRAIREKQPPAVTGAEGRSEEHTSELQSRLHLVCRLLLEKKKNNSSTDRTRLITGVSTCAHLHAMTTPPMASIHRPSQPPSGFRCRFRSASYRCPVRWMN